MGTSLGRECSSHDAEREYKDMDEDVMRIMETNFRQVTLEDANAKAELATTDAKIAGLNSLYSQDPYAVEATDAVEAVSSGEFPDAAEIQDMKAQLCKLEEDVRSFVMRYRKVGHGRSLSYPTRRFFDEKMQGISDEMHRLHRGASTVSSSENTVSSLSWQALSLCFMSSRPVQRAATGLAVTTFLRQGIEWIRCGCFQPGEPAANIFDP